MNYDYESLRLLIEASKGIKAEYLNNVWTTMASFIVVMGWILTSKETRLFIGKRPLIKKLSIITAVLTFCIHAGVLVETKNESRIIQKHITEMVRIDDEQSDSQPKTKFPEFKNSATIYEIPTKWPLYSSILNGMIVFLLIVVLFRIDTNIEKDKKLES